MKRFPMPLQVELTQDGSGGTTLAGFMYQDPDWGLVQVPAGFDTDFASVRPLRTMSLAALLLSLAIGALGVTSGWLGWVVLGGVLATLGGSLGALGFGVLLLYAAVVGYGNGPAVIHDWLYSTGGLSRKASDEVFYNALRSSRTARWRAWLMWAGVRIGGHSRYKR